MYKVVLLGEGGVGKSALVIQFLQNRFVLAYDPTIEDTYRQQLTIDGEEVMAEILDTAGQEAYGTLREQYIRAGHGFLLVFSVSHEHSFTKIDNYRKAVLRIKEGASVPIVLVANKCDLDEKKRHVSTEDGKMLARSYGCPFIETSAMTRVNVDDMFFLVLRALLKKQATGKDAVPRFGRSLSSVGAEAKAKDDSDSDPPSSGRERTHSTDVKHKKKRKFCAVS